MAKSSPQPDKKPHFAFPKSFFWGSATSSHQVEGGQDNNWTTWEKEHAGELSRGSQKAFDTPSVHWYRMKDQALDPANYISGQAVDHYNRFREDFDIAQSLNHTMHRFSLEWSRIEPQPGQYDEAALAHYREVIRALHSRNIEPMVTLFHFSLPKWVEARGGWTSAETLKSWRNYVAKVVDALGDDVTYWCTVNEPEVFSTFSYALGFWPPQQRSFLKAARSYASLLPRAHIDAYRIIKRHNPKAQVGAAKNNMWYQATGRFVSPILERLAVWWGNHVFLDKIKKYQDFIGINYYFKYNLKGFGGEIDQQNPSEIGWGLHPEGLAVVLQDLHKRYAKPVIVTECGLADSTDELRTWYLKEILRAVHRAMEAGVQVQGFLYWSLLDNFEWDKGFWPQFGLVAVNRNTQKRTIRPSAREYAKIIAANGLD